MRPIVRGRKLAGMSLPVGWGWYAGGSIGSLRLTARACQQQSGPAKNEIRGLSLHLTQ